MKIRIVPMELCVALDMDSRNSNLSLVRELKGLDVWLKVGMRSYFRDGNTILKEIKDVDSNLKIFLDLKLYDIPNTMLDAMNSLIELDVDMINIHASSGRRAMSDIMKAFASKKSRPLIVAVTALTSFSEDEFKSIYNTDISSSAKEMAITAKECNLDGVVCSVYESKQIKTTLDDNFLTICPAIRPFGEEMADQRRVANIQMAKDNLADFVVVGRAIYKDKNPRDKARAVLKEIETLS